MEVIKSKKRHMTQQVNAYSILKIRHPYQARYKVLLFNKVYHFGSKLSIPTQVPFNVLEDSSKYNFENSKIRYEEKSTFAK